VAFAKLSSVTFGNETSEVLFAKYSGTEIKVDDTPHLLLESSDILARVTD
jgi:co-chaperonin GroES (HSP10)